MKKVEALRAFAEARGHTILELAMSWLVAQSFVGSVIAGATTPEQVEANVKAANWMLSAADLTEIANYAKAAEDSWLRIRGIRVLKGLQLAVVRELAAWREHHAREHDRPRKWVLGDDVLIDLAI